MGDTFRETDKPLLLAANRVGCGAGAAGRIRKQPWNRCVGGRENVEIVGLFSTRLA
jgi:hypothetical protein